MLRACAQKLAESPHDYETHLAISLERVWLVLGLALERQLLLKRGVCLPILGKFAFLRDVLPPRAVFQLSDKFQARYHVCWRRASPGLLMPTPELNLALVAQDVGDGVGRHQLITTLEAVLHFLGETLQNGTASGRIRVGTMGALHCEGRSLRFVFDRGFVARSGDGGGGSGGGDGHRKGTSMGVTRRMEPSLTKGDQPLVLPRALSVQMLTPSASGNPKKPIDSAVTMHMSNCNSNSNDNATKGLEMKKTVKTKKRRHRHHHQSTGGLLTLPPDLSPAKPIAIAPRSEALPPAVSSTKPSRGILPPFLRHELGLTPSTLTNKEGSATSIAWQRARDREQEAQHQQMLALTRKETEIAERTRASQRHQLQERATKIAQQRELNAFLNAQIQQKQQLHKQQQHQQQQQHRQEQEQEQEQSSATVTSSILPCEPRREPLDEVKRKLRHRLHEQVTRKQALAQQQRVIEQAEVAHFMQQLEAQTRRDEQVRRQRQQQDRAALAADWREQASASHRTS